ncbi:MAG: hypothetical protein LAQ69_04940 [Acidobacteriia bacterium]|nr:hypothetical protein [Terriglobia bacterium]
MSNEQLLGLVEEAGFIFRGRVVRRGTPEQHSVPGAEDQTATVAVAEILRSTDVMRGLAGMEVIVVGEHAAGMKEGSSHIFLTTCLVLGDHAVLRDLAHFEASGDAVRDIAEAVRIAEERPLHQRVAGAELIVTGKVSASRPLAPPSIRRSEHDPDWWIASVAVRSVVKGAKVGKEIDVVFANSEDIAWYKSPKLHEGAGGIFILRKADPKEVPEKGERTTYQATDPLDFLPAERLPEVERALERGKGDR